jgi:Rrf2 family protein
MFSKETEYAIRALVYIQTRNMDGIKPGVEEISDRIDSPRFFTARILHRLAKIGFIGSQKGRNGGFFFDPKKPFLTLKEVITTIEGDKLLIGCGFGMKHCNENNPCPMHNQYALIRNALNLLTSTQTIQSLAGQQTIKNILSCESGHMNDELNDNSDSKG